MDGTPTVSFRRRLPFVSFLFLVIVAILLPNRVWNTLLIGLGGLIVIAYLWARHLGRGLHGTRNLRFGWMAVGDRLSEQFEIVNNSGLPAHWVEVIDGSNVPGYQAAVVRSIGAGASDRWRQAAVCQQRGQFRLGPWALHSGDPFGLFKVTVSYPVANEIIIHPPIHTHIPIPLPAGQGEGPVRTRQRPWRANINAAGVRDYQPGDPTNWIHWAKSARYDNLIVRQFDRDAAGDIWLLLDMQEAGQVGSGPDGTEEQIILLATALAVRSLNENRGIGLAAYGRTPQLIPPALGQGQQWRLLRTLALIGADGEGDIAQAVQDLGQVAHRGSAAVIITANNDGEWIPTLLQLAQRGITSTVVLLDAESYRSGNIDAAEKGEGTAENLRQIIRRLGMDCYIIHKGDIKKPDVDQERHGYWEFKVTPSGKAIIVRNPLEEGA
ncbi:MAG: DUF58 domain-containing protein [Candidatus Promineifilaceae bacterium]